MVQGVSCIPGDAAGRGHTEGHVDRAAAIGASIHAGDSRDPRAGDAPGAGSLATLSCP